MDVAAGVIRGVERELTRLQRENERLHKTLQYAEWELVRLHGELCGVGQWPIAFSIRELKDRIAAAAADDTEARDEH